MKNHICLGLFLGVVLQILGAASSAQDTGKAQLLVGDELNKLLPTSVFLDGLTPPVEKRNAAGARMENGKILLVAIIETSGYSSAAKEKYSAILLTQGSLTLGKGKISPGAYGLGKKKIVAGGKESESFVLYDLGGNAVAEIPAQNDAKLRPALPIQLKLDAAAAPRLYLGRDFVTFSSR
jgi:hypothetical protein